MPALSIEAVGRLERSWGLIVRSLGKSVDDWFPLVEMAFWDPEESTHEVIIHRLLAQMNSPQRLSAFILKLRELRDVPIFLKLLKVISHNLFFQSQGYDALKILLKMDRYLLIDVGRYILNQHARSWFRHRKYFAFLSDADYLLFLNDIVRSVNKDQEALRTFICACQPNIDFQMGDMANSPISISDYILKCIFSEVSQDPSLRRIVLSALFRSKLEVRQYFPLLQRIYTTMNGLLSDISQAIPAPYEQRVFVVEPLIEIFGFNINFILQLYNFFSFEDIYNYWREDVIAKATAVPPTPMPAPVPVPPMPMPVPHREGPASLAQIEPQRPSVTSGLPDKAAQLTVLLKEWRRNGFDEPKDSLFQCVAEYDSLLSVLRVILEVYDRNPKAIEKGFLLVGSRLNQERPCQAILPILFETAALRGEFIRPVLSAFSADRYFDDVLKVLAGTIQDDRSIVASKKRDVFLELFNRRLRTNDRVRKVVSIAKRRFLDPSNLTTLHLIALDQVVSKPNLAAYLEAVNDSDQDAAFFRFLVRYCDRGLNGCLAKLAASGWAAETLIQQCVDSLYEIKGQASAFITLRYALNSDCQASKSFNDSLALQIYFRLAEKMRAQKEDHALLKMRQYLYQSRGFQDWCIASCPKADILRGVTPARAVSYVPANFFSDSSGSSGSSRSSGSSGSSGFSDCASSLLDAPGRFFGPVAGAPPEAVDLLLIDQDDALELFKELNNQGRGELLATVFKP